MGRHVLSGVLFCAGAALAQQANPAPPALAPALSFEVAAIRPSAAGSNQSSGVTTTKGRISAENVTLKRLIRSAYGFPETQILGGPIWMEQDRFDLIAKSDTPASDDDLSKMLRALLAERFRLVVHRERRTMQAYSLMVEKGGLRAKRSVDDSRSTTNINQSDSVVSFDATGCTMEHLTQILADLLHAPVEDATSAEGAFDFHVEWVPDDMQARPETAGTGTAQGPSVSSALREQLGLRLESRRIPGDILMVDHAEPPNEN